MGTSDTVWHLQGYGLLNSMLGGSWLRVPKCPSSAPTLALIPSPSSPTPPYKHTARREPAPSLGLLPLSAGGLHPVVAGRNPHAPQVVAEALAVTTPPHNAFLCPTLLPSVPRGVVPTHSSGNPLPPRNPGTGQNLLNLLVPQFPPHSHVVRWT